MDGKTGKAEQLQRLCQRWLTWLQQGSQEHRRDVFFEEWYRNICPDMFKDSEASLSYQSP